MSVNSQSIKIRTKSVEKVLEPIILQLSELVNPQRQLNRPKGLSKSGDEILKLVKISIDEFVDRGKEILRECPKMADDFMIVLKDIQVTGDQLSEAISAFVAQPINEDLRKNVSRSARSLLSSVTRLLILADLVDVQRLQQCLQKLKEDVSFVKNTRDMGELTSLCTPINDALNELFALLQPRTKDMLNPTQREDLDLFQYCLRQACNMLLAASKAHLMHPELATAAANRVYCAQLVCDVIDKISDACNPTCLPEAPSPLLGQAVMSILQEIMDTVRCESEKEDNRNGAGLSRALDQLSVEITALENSANLGKRIHTALEASLQHLRNEINELLDVWEFQVSKTKTNSCRFCARRRGRCRNTSWNIKHASFLFCFWGFPPPLRVPHLVTILVQCWIENAAVCRRISPSPTLIPTLLTCESEFMTPHRRSGLLPPSIHYRLLKLSELHFVRRKERWVDK
uniref:Vinculin n=1 Tax=Schistocephalus solidus TaxID=70667 RepID=A0A0X3P197_SCHSO